MMSCPSEVQRPLEHYLLFRQPSTSLISASDKSQNPYEHVPPPPAAGNPPRNGYIRPSVSTSQPHFATLRRELPFPVDPTEDRTPGDDSSADSTRSLLSNYGTGRRTLAVYNSIVGWPKLSHKLVPPLQPNSVAPVTSHSGEMGIRDERSVPGKVLLTTLYASIFLLLLTVAGLVAGIFVVFLGLDFHNKCRLLSLTPDPLSTLAVGSSPYSTLMTNDLVEQNRTSRIMMNSFRGENIRDNVRWLSGSVHVAGTPEQLSLMDQIEEKYRELGFDVQSYEYDVLLNYPDYKRPNTIHAWTDGAWKEVSNGIADRIGPEEALEQQLDPRALVWWNAYSNNGSAVGQIVYVNYGSQEDFDNLKKLNVSLFGKIALVRYGGIFRGDKALLAEQSGAIGVIIYSDPFDYAPEPHSHNRTFPDDVWLPPGAAQRGTLLRTVGDPQTPFFPSKPYVHRSLDEAELRKRKVLSSVPVMPIGYRDAVKIMRDMDLMEVPWASWRGGMRVTYRITGSKQYLVTVRGVTQRRRIKNVIATIAGESEPDRWVLLGNHVDAWVKGSVDPNSATGTLLETARVISEALKARVFRPRRTLAFCAWDAEEYGLIGSTEWVEEMLKPLGSRAVAYINVDNINGNNSLSVKAVPLLYRAIVDAAAKVPHPNPYERQNGRSSLLDAWRFYSPKGPLPGDKAVPAVNLPGSGSDFQRFISYAGIPVADLRMEGAPLYTYMLYHSMFEIPWVNEQFIDPTGAVFTAVGQLWLELARNLAESLIIPFNVEDYASQLEDFRWRMDAQLMHLGIDKALGHEYSKKMAMLDVALQEFRAAAVDIQNIVQAVNNGERAVSVRQAEMINSRLAAVERCFILDAGLYPERSFFRHAVFSASEHDVYSGVTFALIVDPAVEWSLATNASSRRHWLETVLMGFTRLQYTIESAVHVLRLHGFDENGFVQRL